MDKIYILLPVHNRCNSTKSFIDCLNAQVYHNYHLILIDDGSTDGTEEMVRSRVEPLTVIKGKGSWWWAGSLQQGISWLKSVELGPQDIILIINDDVTFDQYFFKKASEALNSKRHTILLTQCFSAKTGVCIDAGVQANLRSLTFKAAPSPDKINCSSTWGLFIRWKDLELVGDFYPKLIPHYLSDYEFTIRAHRNGFNLYSCPELKVWLDEDTTGFQDFKGLDFLTFLKRYFSKRSVANPLSWTCFVILACPKAWIPLNLLRVWKRVILTILRHALLPEVEEKVNANTGKQT